jgi:methyltransferase family protein
VGGTDVSGLAAQVEPLVATVRRFVPWWGKMCAKVLLARIPLGYRIWRRLNLFVHGQMDHPEYALGVMRSHLARVGWPELRGRTIMELGPGDSISSAVIAKALGADRTILVDTAAYAKSDLAPYRRLVERLEREGLSPPTLTGVATLSDLLVRCNAVYLTNGLSSIKTVSDGSVDLVFSQAVLEHVRKSELAAVLRETFRITRSDGFGSHRVDLTDHFSGQLNSLRFSEKLWEAEWMVRSGFYTNRIRFVEMCRMFEHAGFDVNVVQTDRFSDLPTPRAKLTEPYRSLPDEDLLVSAFDAILRPSNPPK